MRIFIDKGHGGSDSGAIGNGMKESKINSDVADWLCKLLTEAGYEVMVSNPLGGKKLELSERQSMAVAFKADISISIHHNSGGGDGSEVWVEHNDIKSIALGTLILSEFSKLNNIRGLKVKVSTKDASKNYLAMLNIPNCINVLTEFAFIDTKDAFSVDSLNDRKSEAQAIFDAIAMYEKVVK